MTQRASAAAATGDRILDAATARYAALPYERMRLEDVAADAGVTTQTVIRRFGSKAQLVVSVAERGLARIAEARAAQPTTDPAATLDDLVAHYRVWGALILKVYSEASHIEGMREIAAAGRAYHIGWCERAFAGHLPPGLGPRERTRRIAQIVAICDATTWRILNDEFALDDEQIGLALSELLSPLLESS